MKSIVSGLLTTYDETGTGKVVLLLHGWGDNSNGLKGLQRELQAKYRVIVPDLPGFGGSQLPPATWSLDDYAGFVADFLVKVQAEPVYAIIGHSNGGAIAIRGLAAGKLRAEKLVLLASAGVRIRQPLRQASFSFIAKVGKLLTAWLPLESRQKLRRRLYNIAGSDALVVPALAETFKNVVRQDVQADAGRLNLPSLLINGGRDRAVPPAYGETLHRAIKNSELIMLPDAGHFVQNDDLPAVSRAIKEFLS